MCQQKWFPRLAQVCEVSGLNRFILNTTTNLIMLQSGVDVISRQIHVALWDGKQVSQSILHAKWIRFYTTISLKNCFKESNAIVCGQNNMKVTKRSVLILSISYSNINIWLANLFLFRVLTLCVEILLSCIQRFF